MRKVSSSSSFPGHCGAEPLGAERILFASNGAKLALQPNVRIPADESVFWVIKEHLKLMPLSYVRAGFTVDEMLHHISILTETQNACRVALHVACTKLPCKEFGKISSFNDSRSRTMEIHFAYPSFRSHFVAIKTLGLPDVKLQGIQIFHRIRQRLALGIAHIQYNTDDAAEGWTEICKLPQLIPGLSRTELIPLKASTPMDPGCRCENLNFAYENLKDKRARPQVSCSDSICGLPQSKMQPANEDLWNQVLQSFGDDVPLSKALTKWWINGTDINLGVRIGLGSSATVYEGVYREQLKVAVKILNGFHRTQAIDFRRELLSLGSCFHKRILRLVGTCIDSRLGICIITRYMNGGSLRDYLQSRQKLQTKEVIRLAKNIAEGMFFLHSRRVIHMDLKSPNIFLDEDGSAVIGDLGSARLFDEREEARKDIGTYRWMAPEVFGDEGGDVVATPMSDIYSFGILLWELVSCELPYADYSPLQAAAGVVMHSLRPPIPEDCFPPLKCLIQKCWSQIPAQRPSSLQIIKMLRIISARQPAS